VFFQAMVRRSTYTGPVRYPDTVRFLATLKRRRPAPSLPSRLDEYFERLTACTTPDAARPIEDAIWDAWMYHGHEDAEFALERTVRDIAAKRYDIAESRLVLILRARPDWAEAWNKRATLYYLQGRDDESVAAIRRTLELEPRHFGALCGLGEILRGLDEKEAALLAFRSALRLHPQLSGIGDALAELITPAGSRSP
jgi:tetratricopeptide (TPR) repeat protein